MSSKTDMQLKPRVIQLLKDAPEKRFTVRELAEEFTKKFPREAETKLKNSKQSHMKSIDDVVNQLNFEISSFMTKLSKSEQFIKTIEERPRKFYWSDKSEASEIEEAEDKCSIDLVDNTANHNVIHIREEDLYPLLSTYLYDELNVYSMRIDEKKSSNRNGNQGNKWLHPDLVGMEDLSEGWHDEIKTCVKGTADSRARFWSFEVKLKINRSNVREVLFQTVSNSTWANYAYLVAAEINGEETLNELRLLCAAHGVGVIRLDAKNPL